MLIAFQTTSFFFNLKKIIIITTNYGINNFIKKKQFMLYLVPWYISTELLRSPSCSFNTWRLLLKNFNSNATMSFNFLLLVALQFQNKKKIFINTQPPMKNIVFTLVIHSGIQILHLSLITSQKNVHIHRSLCM